MAVILNSLVRPPAVNLNVVTVPAPTLPETTRKSENAGGRKWGWWFAMSAMHRYTSAGGAPTVPSTTTELTPMTICLPAA